MGGPLILIGAVVAATGGTVAGGGLLFWIGAGLVALGVAAFFA